MTRGWDPYDASFDPKKAKDRVDEAQKVVANPGKPKDYPKLSGTAPPILFWFFPMPLPPI